MTRQPSGWNLEIGRRAPRRKRAPLARPAAGKVLVWLAAAACLATAGPFAQAAEYRDSQALEQRLEAFARAHPGLVRLESLAKSPGERGIWLLDVGWGADDERATQPAMLVVAGIEGNDLAGSAAALDWIERLTARDQGNAQVTALLRNTTLYVVPRLDPDAAEAFFASPKRETDRGASPADDDGDAMADEDGPEDLNGDGLVTWMRVQDPAGEYVLDPKEDRLLLKADPLKGQAGEWRYLPEGIDNDKDEHWNEDGPGGVNLNRNFPFGFEFFAPDAGRHQVSETETRALADFAVAHSNIGIVFTFGAADNLLKTPKGADSKSSKSDPPAGRTGFWRTMVAERESRPRSRRTPPEPMKTVDEKDLPYYRELGETYRKALGLEKEVDGAVRPGTFSDWMYFHRGRLSLAARAWTPRMAVELQKAEDAKKKEREKGKDQETDNAEKSEKPAKDENSAGEGEKTGEQEEPEQDEPGEGGKEKKGKKDDAGKGGKEEREALAWFDEHAPDAFLAWQPFEHPDFPGRRVEIGGYAPYARTNPPAPLLDAIAAKHADFLTSLSLRLPRIGVRKAEAKPLGGGVYEIELEIENTGHLPTALGHGERTREVHPTRVVLELEDGSILSGARITPLGPIAGSGGMEKLHWTVHVPGQERVTFEVISMLGGRVKGEVRLNRQD